VGEGEVRSLPLLNVDDALVHDSPVRGEAELFLSQMSPSASFELPTMALLDARHPCLFEHQSSDASVGFRQANQILRRIELCLVAASQRAGS
jgi:hypothetical protein